MTNSCHRRDGPGGCAAGRGLSGRRGLALAGLRVQPGAAPRDSAGRAPARAQGRADGALGRSLRGVGGLPTGRAGQRVRRSRPPIRIRLRRARRLWPQLHARPRRRPQAAQRTRGLPLLRLRAIARVPERGPPARRDRRRRLRPSPRARRAPAGRVAACEPSSGASSRLRRSARRLVAASERFDAWESCVSWVPVTEYGDPDGGFGYRFGLLGTAAFEFRPALSIDRSDWDDPDYMFLAFVGGDRPGKVCQNEPGEGID